MSKGSSTPLTSEDPTQSLIPAPSELLPKSHLLCSPLAIPCSTFALFQGTAMLGISHKAPHKQIFPVRPAAGPEAHTVPFHLPVQRCYALLKTNLSTSLLQPFYLQAQRGKSRKKKPKQTVGNQEAKRQIAFAFSLSHLLSVLSLSKFSLCIPLQHGIATKEDDGRLSVHQFSTVLHKMSQQYFTQQKKSSPSRCKETGFCSGTSLICLLQK